MQDIHSPSLDRLFSIILRLETVEECYRFFEDICTTRELEDLAQRLDAAFLLDAGCNYQEIAKQVGISTATISRVSRCLKYGDGYRMALDKAKETDS